MEEESPLTLATRDGDIDRMLVLLKQRADPNVRDILGETPLFEAAANGNEPMTALLLLARADALLRSSAGTRASEMAESVPVRDLIEAFANSGTRSAFQAAEWAAMSALDPEVSESLITSRQSRAAQQLSPPPKAESRDLEPVLPEKVPGGGVVAPTAAVAASAAAPDEDFDDDEPPIVHAVREGDVSLVQDLLRQKADPNSLDILGEPLIFEASASGSVRMAAILVLAGADLSFRSPGPQQNTACDLAAERPMRALLKLAEGSQPDAARFVDVVLNELDGELKASMTSFLNRDSAAKASATAPAKNLVGSSGAPVGSAMPAPSKAATAAATSKVNGQGAFPAQRTAGYGSPAALAKSPVNAPPRPPPPAAARTADATSVRNTTPAEAATKAAAFRGKGEDSDSEDDDELPPLIDGPKGTSSTRAQPKATPTPTVQRSELASSRTATPAKAAAKVTQEESSDDDDELPPLINAPKGASQGIGRGAVEAPKAVASRASAVESAATRAPSGGGQKTGPGGGEASLGGRAPAAAQKAPSKVRDNVPSYMRPSTFSGNGPTRGAKDRLYVGDSDEEDDEELDRLNHFKEDITSDDSDEDSDDLSYLTRIRKEPPAPEVVVDVEVIARKAVSEQSSNQVKIACKSNDTFLKVKTILAERLGCADLLATIWLVHKSDAGVYVSFKDSDKVGNVREVLYLAPTLSADSS